MARLAECVLVVTTLVGLAQLLGSFGAFELAPLIISSAVLGTLSLALRRLPAVHDIPWPAPEPGRLSRGEIALVTTAIGLTALPFLSGTLRSLDRGVTDYDSNWYHLPLAGGFVQQGWTTRLHFTGSVPQTYFPANNELLHAVGMRLTGTDIVSPMLNVGWFAVALLAAWCIGERCGRQVLSVLAVCVLLSLPIMAYTQAGSAEVDLAGIALLLASVALIVRADQGPQGARLLVLGGAAAGVLVGIKFIYLPVVAVLALTVLVVAPAQRRWLLLARWMAVVACVGAFWYVRNLVRAGSPLPSAPLRLAGFGFAYIGDGTLDCGTRSVAHYASSPSIWRSVFAPSLRYWYGPLWWVLVLGTAGAFALALVRGRGSVGRPLALAGVVAVVTYVVTPATAGGPVGDAHCFGIDTRLLFPGLALGAVAMVFGVRNVAAQRVIVALLAGTLLMTVWSSVRLNEGWGGRYYVLSGVLLIGAGAAGLIFWRLRTAPARRQVACVVTFIAVLGLGWLPSRVWPERRYSRNDLTADLGTLPAWADAHGPMRIAIAGFFEQWPLYGWRLDNVVGLPVVESQLGALRSATNCDSWRRALRRGRFDHVVILSDAKPAIPRERRWIAGDAAATRIKVRGTKAAVYRFDAEVRASPCDLDPARSP